jgi:histidine triad (HIT) family protein
MKDDCIFCKIVKGEIPSQKVFEDDSLIVIKDIKPKAPVHLLIIPKVHVGDIIGVDETTWSDIKKVVLALIKEKGLKSFRLVHNGGKAALIEHMHVHLLGEVDPEREL